MTRQPTPREAARPFDYAEPTPDEMRAAIGGRNWVVARRTPRIVERYGPDVICLSQAKYASAETRAIEARGWARPCELVIRKLLALAEMGAIDAYDPQGASQTRAEAKELLVEAKKPR